MYNFFTRGVGIYTGMEFYFDACIRVSSTIGRQWILLCHTIGILEIPKREIPDWNDLQTWETNKWESGSASLTLFFVITVSRAYEEGGDVGIYNVHDALQYF